MEGNGGVVRIKAGRLALGFDTERGVWSFSDGGEVLLCGVGAAFGWKDGTVTVDCRDFASHRVERTEGGIRFLHDHHPAFSGMMAQEFRFSEDGRGFFTAVTAAAEEGVRTNRIEAVVAENAAYPVEAFWRIPFDNDKWAEPKFDPIGRLGPRAVSYEVGVLVGEGSALLIGSVEHDTWKSGVIVGTGEGRILSLRAAAGIADENTRDVCPHGFAEGHKVRSPLFYIGYFGDWREAFSAYGEANAALCPPRPDPGHVPFGFNSWGVLQDKVRYGKMIRVSDYVKEALQPVWASDGAPVYVNFDSFWDFLTHGDPDCTLSRDDALRDFAAHAHANGQKAGIYFTPFAAWHGTEDDLRRSRIPGTDFTYYDAALKRSDGQGLYGKLDGGFALDPTHPATVARFEKQLRNFIDWGYDYVKLDFMGHGALEGLHADPAVSTGMQAYRYGMERIRAVCGDRLKINLSIAPLFPHQYAEGRRISCDAFSSLDDTRHVLTCLTAGFWERALYPWPDPDHLVVWGRDGKVTEGEARCRVTAGVIAGTSFLAGDDLSDVIPGSPKDRRLREMLADPDIVHAAKAGACYVPWNMELGKRCADLFLHRGADALYVAAFNFDDRARMIEAVLPVREAERTACELWRGERLSVRDGILRAVIPPCDAGLYRIAMNEG